MGGDSPLKLDRRPTEKFEKEWNKNTVFPIIPSP